VRSERVKGERGAPRSRRRRSRRQAPPAPGCACRVTVCIISLRSRKYILHIRVHATWREGTTIARAFDDGRCREGGRLEGKRTPHAHEYAYHARTQASHTLGRRAAGARMAAPYHLPPGCRVVTVRQPRPRCTDAMHRTYTDPPVAADSQNANQTLSSSRQTKPEASRTAGSPLPAISSTSAHAHRCDHALRGYAQTLSASIGWTFSCAARSARTSLGRACPAAGTGASAGWMWSRRRA